MIPEWSEAIARSLLLCLKQRDPYSYGHSLRVAYHARFLAEAAGLNEYQQLVIEFASLFHDLGKIGISDKILLKPGKLTEDEEEIMREHPAKSAELLTPLDHIPFFRSTLPGVKHHHERMDGKGYPDGIHGENIPLSARIILIADTYDAMTTTRPYRTRLQDAVAYAELKRFAGVQFDEHLVDIFVHTHPAWSIEVASNAPYEELIEPFRIGKRLKKTA
ncbi:MAG: HD-GYP domain-containing protein [Bdellovibrionota bacterium]